MNSMFRCAPTTCSPWFAAISDVMIEPQSPPWVPYRVYPSSPMSASKARAVRVGPQPGSRGFPLKP
jgi:hypothetical protein